MRSIILIASFLIGASASAQWRKIADLPGHAYGTTVDEPVTSVYFLGLPGPPRIGFAGTEVGLWKTTDGGTTWVKIWNEPYSVTKLCFKDSLQGWFSVFNGSGFLADTACYRTTDGGNTWTPIEIPGSIYGSNAVFYEPHNKFLFLSLTDSCLLLSQDMGEHWKSVTKIETGGISFFDDSNGIAAAYPDSAVDSTKWCAIVRTTNGGLTWDSVLTLAECQQPLAITGTSVCFSSWWSQAKIWRSDDHGKTWRVTKDFGFETGEPYADGVIGGTLSRLDILTDQGIYNSTDEGLTWSLEPGSPKYNPDGQGGQTFYCANGVTIAGATDISGGRYDGAGLWEEAWPQSSVLVPEPVASTAISVFPNPTPGPVTIRGAAGTITVTNVLGEVVVGSGNRVPGTGEAQLDLSKLPAGTYFVQIQTAAGIVLRKVIRE